MWLPLACPLLGTWPTIQACALTRNPTSDPLVHRLALNPLSHTPARTQDRVSKKKFSLLTPETEDKTLLHFLYIKDLCAHM